MSIDKAYKSSAIIFDQVSRLQNPGLYDQIRAVTKRDIVVVKGAHDHVETLLDTLEVPYELIDAGALKKHNGGKVIFVNCSSYNNDVSNGMLSSFVQEGGRVVSTDWAVGLIERAFPKRLHKVADTTDDVVEIQCNTGLARKLIGLNYAQCHPKWWLEGASHIYDVGQGVVPIITSKEMESKYGKPYVAVGFTEGKGEVIHFISHLVLQRTHLRTKDDEKGLEDFLAKMGATKTMDMDDAKVAELESAYSTLNTLAHLCVPSPLMNVTMKSTYKEVTGAAKSKSLAP
ncbi:hypothetical protein HY639_00485 [Candidatus Woesearchaeota archaeon]|nr:hypothetical protein [Candidatus Woesearchaeota archaeon]